MSNSNNDIQALAARVDELAAQVAEVADWIKAREEKEFRSRLIAPDLAAQATGRSENDLVEIARSGTISRHKVGKRFYYDIAELVDVFGAHTMTRLRSVTRTGVTGLGSGCC